MNSKIGHYKSLKMNFKSHFFDVIKRSMLQIQYIESVQIPFSDMLLYLQLDAKMN